MTYGGVVTNGVRAARWGISVVLAVACLAVVAVRGSVAQALPAADYPAELTAFYTQELDWKACRSRMQCAWLTVPLDYAKPSGPTIRIRVTRQFATTDARQGSLVVNPGGPGMSGLDFAQYVASGIAPDVARQFDMVGFDPRGVQASAPVTCMTGRQTTRWYQTDPSPNTAAEESVLWKRAGALPRGCLSMSPAMARHVGSDASARDLDVLRAALGEPKLNWLGFSYGTYLGTLYAERFPDRVGRFVLDGPIDPSLDTFEISRAQSSAFQVAVSRFAQDCLTHPDCAWSGSRADVVRGINTLLESIDARPIPEAGGGRLNQASALSAIFYAMYSPTLWPLLRQGLAEAVKGNGLTLQTLADLSQDRIGRNRYSSNMASAFPAISCWDSPAPPGRAAIAKAAQTWSRGAVVPEMASAMAWGLAPCAQWFGHSDIAVGPAHSSTAAPILIVGTTYDPATPYDWAVALSSQLPTSTLLTHDGDGHTAYGTGSKCVDAAVSAYLLTGVVPGAGTTCP